MRMQAVFVVLGLLNAYDQNGLLLGKMCGGTKEGTACEEDWNENNALVFVGDNGEQEVPLRDIFFDKSEVIIAKRDIEEKEKIMVSELRKFQGNELLPMILEKRLLYFKELRAIAEGIVTKKILKL